MPSSTKDTENRIAEAGSQVTPSAASHSSESQAARGVAASCEIPVEVHGSLKSGTQYAAVTPFHEETRTVIVFPHGCVLRLATTVGVGQMLAITNQNSQRGMLSRVTHVRAYPNLKSYVEIEFTQVDPEFWSIDFAEESAAQGYDPAPSSAAATKPHDFWSEGGGNATATPVAPAPKSKSSSKAEPQEDLMAAWEVKPGSAPAAANASTVAETKKEKTAKPSVAAETKPEKAVKLSPPPSAAKPPASAEEFSLAPRAEEKAEAPLEEAAAQAWAELLVMESHQTQLSAKELGNARSDIEESLAPAPASESHDASGHAGEDVKLPSFDPANPEPISDSVLKELEKLALQHVSEKPPGSQAEAEAESQAGDVSSATKARKDSGRKTSAKPEGKSGAPPRSSPLHTFTGGSSGTDTKAGRTGKDSRENPLHAFTPAPSGAETLPGLIEGVNPHKTQSLADHPEAESESDFGNFLRDPEPRTAAPRVFTGPPEALTARAEVTATLTPLRAKSSKSGFVLGALVAILAGIVIWWFHPLHGSTPVNSGAPVAAAPAPVDSPSQWPSQSPNDAASLDSSAGHPVAVESKPGGAAESAPVAVESKPETDSGSSNSGGGREVIPVPRASGKPAASNATQPAAGNSRAALPAVTLAAPTSSGNAGANGNVEAPEVSSGGESNPRANNLTGIVESSPANVPAPAPVAPATVGGKVREPRLISSVQPVYPQAAMQAHVQGDVTIEATIDERGRVSNMKVLSGPALLQRAAMDAVKQWRYQPSVLNDKPIAVNMVVTVKFHR